ncbi:hypothetical protein [Trinickia mobilis]
MICAQGAQAGGHRGTFLGHPGASMVGTLAWGPRQRAFEREVQ